MSTTRKQVVDAAVTALGKITGIGSVTQKLASFNADDPNSYPKLYVIAQKPVCERASYPHPTADDMEAEMRVQIFGRTYSPLNVNMKTDVDTVMSNVEKALVGDSALAALILDVTLEEDEIDLSSHENIGQFVATYVVTYQYNHNTP